MKLWADKKRREVVFEVGEKVYLKAQPYRFKSLASRPNEKLSPRYYGPFEILERVGNAAYKLALPVTTRIHSVFHVSQLKKSVGEVAVQSQLPPALTEEWELLVQPEEVLGVRKLLNGTEQVLIKWKGLPDFEKTWEDYAVIDTTFPDFHLEDKVKLIGGSIDRPFKHVYRRRGKKEKKKECEEGAVGQEAEQKGENGYEKGITNKTAGRVGLGEGERESGGE